MAESAELLPGTLDLLILKAVSLGDLHGYAVLLRIEQITGGALQIQQGALYPALRGRGRFESDMDAEFHAHMALRAADLERSGLAPDDALRRARVEFGSVERYKEE